MEECFLLANSGSCLARGHTYLCIVSLHIGLDPPVPIRNPDILPETGQFDLGNFSVRAFFSGDPTRK